MLVVCNDISPTITDIPGYEYGLMLILKGYNDNYRCALYFDSLGGLHYAKINEHSPQNNGWHTVATAEPPQEYNLTTTNGRITYSKDQFERVYLYIYLTGITIEENKIIGTLPVGYRPSYLVSTLARIGGSFGTIDISTAGAITLRNTYDSTESGGIFASASFLAA